MNHKILTKLVIGSIFLNCSAFSAEKFHEDLSPGAIGWGNLLVPGFGATLRGQPIRGLTEATLEIGTFYGGTFGVREGSFGIDGSVRLPSKGNIYRTSTGQMLQEFGLKYHMYNTFYHYQQVSLSQENNPDLGYKQPLYRGTFWDTFSAPFRAKNLFSIWTYPVILGGSIFLLYDYSTSKIQAVTLRTSRDAELFYTVSQGAIMPMGSYLGEDVFFRGFLQRELYKLTGSLPVAIVLQSSLFAAGHVNKASSFVVGAYYGIMANALKGNLEPAMASHFWLDVVDGLVTSWTLQRTQGHAAPFNPPVATQVSFPF